MGRRRVCGKTCHDAKRDKCGCWCGGLFHGSKGDAARAAFAEVWSEPPRGDRSDDGGERWGEAIRSARVASMPIFARAAADG